MFSGDMNVAGFGSRVPRTHKLEKNVDAFGEPLNKNGAVIAALVSGAAVESRHPLATGTRVKHVKTQVCGTIRHHSGSFGGRTVAVSWDDGSIGMHRAEELSPE
jgi:hypothetical protein